MRRSPSFCGRPTGPRTDGTDGTDGHREVTSWVAPDLGPCPLEGGFDRMRWALVLCGATDSLRADLRPAAVRRAARRATAAMACMAGPPPTGQELGATVAEWLGARLLPGTDRASLPTAAVDAALVLLADHELATSTMAARLAASTRADLYDALLAALATLAGPLHGGASQRAHALLGVAERDGAAHALNDVLREQGRLPGFGHVVYEEGDPRFGALMKVVEPVLTTERAAVVREVLHVAASHDVPPPNCDLALAVLSWGTGMSPEAGRTLFAVARVAGWTAHYLEELDEPALRFRARAVYAS